jgi:hypothetical protein
MAAQNGHLSIIQWCRANGCSWCDIRAKYNEIVSHKGCESSHTGCESYHRFATIGRNILVV